MGAYINPQDCTKEAWLRLNAREVSREDVIGKNFGAGELPVVLIDNGIFTAVGVAFDDSEVKAFTLPHDGRPKRFYVAKLGDIKKVSDVEKYLNRK